LLKPLLLAQNQQQKKMGVMPILSVRRATRPVRTAPPRNRPRRDQKASKKQAFRDNTQL